MTQNFLFDKILKMNYQPHHRFSISSEVLSQEVNGETVLLDKLTEAGLVTLAS